MQTTALLVCLLIGASLVFASSRVTLFEATAPGASWTSQGRAAANKPFSFIISMKHQDLGPLADAAHRSSDPTSAYFGQHLSYSQMCRMISPPESDFVAVLQWLHAAGIPDSGITRLCESVQVRTTVSVAEALLATELHTFAHTSMNRRLVRHQGTVSVPVEVASAIDTLLGVRDFHAPKRHGVRLTQSAAESIPEQPKPVTVNSDGRCVASNGIQLGTCPFGAACCIDFNQTVNALTCCSVGDVCQAGRCVTQWTETMTQMTTPQTWQDLYGVPQTGVNPGSHSIPVCVVAFNDYYDVYSTQLFTAAFGKPYPSITHYCPTVTTPYFGSDPKPCSCSAHGCDTGESNLDVQCVSSLATGVPMWFWAMQNDNDWIAEWATSVITAFGGQAPLIHTTMPTIFSISYGDTEVDTPVDYRRRSDVMLLQLASMGVAVLVADGDNGVQSTPGTPGSAPINPEWPTSSPWVTSVGATQLTADPQPGCGQFLEHKRASTTSCSGERVSSTGTGSIITSGGGFSSVYARPPYQDSFVRQYLNSGIQLPSASLFNESNRGYPDVTAIGAWLASANDGFFSPVFGTSASTPILAGLFARLNTELRVAGGFSLGFLNPFLYRLASTHPDVFNDIVDGDNGCGTRDQVCMPQAYIAAVGWDPVSGLGSLNYPRLLQYGKNLQGLYNGTTLLPPTPPTPPPEVPKGVIYASLVIGIVGVVAAVVGITLAVRKAPRGETTPLINAAT